MHLDQDRKTGLSLNNSGDLAIPRTTDEIAFLGPGTAGSATQAERSLMDTPSIIPVCGRTDAFASDGIYVLPLIAFEILF